MPSLRYPLLCTVWPHRADPLHPCVSSFATPQRTTAVKAGESTSSIHCAPHASQIIISPSTHAPCASWKILPKVADVPSHSHLFSHFLIRILHPTSFPMRCLVTGYAQCLKVVHLVAPTLLHWANVVHLPEACETIEPSFFQHGQDLGLKSLIGAGIRAAPAVKIPQTIPEDLSIQSACSTNAVISPPDLPDRIISVSQSICGILTLRRAPAPQALR